MAGGRPTLGAIWSTASEDERADIIRGFAGEAEPPHPEDTVFECAGHDADDDTYVLISALHLARGAKADVWVRCDQSLEPGRRYEGQLEWPPLHRGVHLDFPRFVLKPDQPSRKAA